MTTDQLDQLRELVRHGWDVAATNAMDPLAPKESRDYEAGRRSAFQDLFDALESLA